MTTYTGHSGGCRRKALALREAGGDGLDILAGEPAVTIDIDDVQPEYVEALIDEFYSRGDGSKYGFTAEEIEKGKQNCLRPWGHEIKKYFIRDTTDGKVVLYGVYDSGGMDTCLPIIELSYREYAEAVGEDYEDTRERWASNHLVAERAGLREADGVASGLVIMGGEPAKDEHVHDDGGPNSMAAKQQLAERLISEHRDERAWVLSYSDGYYEDGELDGAEYGGRRVMTYDEAVAAWQSYPLEDELDAALSEYDYADEHYELHILLNYANGLTDNGSTDDGDWEWDVLIPVADRYVLYDSDEDD